MCLVGVHSRSVFYFLFFCRFEKEDSLWGPFLSVVNGEQARQTDRRYWHIASDGKTLSRGKTEGRDTPDMLYFFTRLICTSIFYYFYFLLSPGG